MELKTAAGRKDGPIKNVTVLGCGPAGLMAAHAAAINGCDVVIVSKKRKSEMFGCQYLHRPIPLVSNGAGIKVDYQTRGTRRQYVEKVYGRQARGVVGSPELLEKEHLAWDIREAYDELWKIYSPYIIDETIDWDRGNMIRGTRVWQDCDLLVSSIPAPALCLRPQEHEFFVEEIWTVGDAPERGVFSPVGVDEFTVICNGEDEPAWYRAANVFGYNTVEWPGRMERKPPFEEVKKIQKPVRTTCDCWPQILRVGRFGRWQKGILSHEAFESVETQLGQWRLF